MLYEFKSRAAGTVIMTDAIGAQVLEILGKSGPTGIVTVTQLPSAIASLQAAAAHSKTQAKATESGQQEPSEQDVAMGKNINLATRLLPLIDLMQTSLKAEKDVTWGV
jgi:Domain of unknown function (DUF1840)